MVTELDLIRSIKDLKHGEIGEVVKERIKLFDSLNQKSSRDWFKELCFCILTANFTAEGGIKIQKEVGGGFLTLDKAQLSAELRRLKHRFPNKRAEFIMEARKYADNLKSILLSFPNEFEARQWIVKNIKGINCKEGSHFLRNVGYRNVAIIDRHVLNLLCKYQVIHSKPKALTRKAYLEIENVLRAFADKLNLSLAELDLYLWFIETGKILK
jgi:N-glycosylase/DNA lyase